MFKKIIINKAKCIKDYKNKLIEDTDDLSKIDKTNIIKDITAKHKYISLY